MSAAHDMKLVAKHTFLECVEEDSAGKSQRSRAVTDFGTFVPAAPDRLCQTYERAHGPTQVPSNGAQMVLCTGPYPARQEPHAVDAQVSAISAPPETGHSSGIALLVPVHALHSQVVLLPYYACSVCSPGSAPPGDHSFANSVQRCEESREKRTTLMLRNVPKRYSRSALISLLNSMGFAARYDFVYIPVDFGTGYSLSYALVNLCSPADAVCLRSRLDGFTQWPTPSENVCKVSWSDPHQGLEALVERYRNSPVMHASVPDEWKPAVFSSGTRGSFPAPSRPIKAPKVRVRGGNS